MNNYFSFKISGHFNRPGLFDPDYLAQMWNLPDIWISWITRYLIICIEGLRMMIWMIPLHMTTRWRYGVNDRILNTWCHKRSAVKISRINHYDVFQISFRSKGRICLFRKKYSLIRGASNQIWFSKMVICSDIKRISLKKSSTKLHQFPSPSRNESSRDDSSGRTFPFFECFPLPNLNFFDLCEKTN